MQRLSTPDARPPILLPSVNQVLRSPGRPLDAPTRTFMESRFAQDFSRVRIHTDTRAADSARTLNALAYTIGHDVVFASGHYAPATTAGRRLLAHELTHVIQQRSGGMAAGTGSVPIGRPGDRYDREAESVANRVAAGDLYVGDAISAAPPLLQRYSWSEFVGDVEHGVSTVGKGLVTIGNTVMTAAEAAASWVVTTAGRAAISAANALAGLFGGSVTVRGACLVITIPEIPLFPSFQKTLGETPPIGRFIPILEGGTKLGPIPVAGTFGILVYAQGSVEAAVGPGVLRGIRVELCPLAGRYMGTGQLYIAAAIGPRLTFFGGLAAAVGTLIPAEPPVPVIVIVQGGLRGTGTAWFIGAVQDIVTVLYSGGTLSFSNITNLMGGVLLQGDVDFFAALRLYEKIICQYVRPLKHWETGRAWKLTIPITASLGGGRGAAGIGPITWGPMPIKDIETAIRPLPSGWNCLSWAEIKKFLCDKKILPQEFCEAAIGLVGVAGNCVANDNLGEVADSFISRCRKASIRSEFPGELLSETLGNIKKGKTARHKKAWKLLNDNRFKKPGTSTVTPLGLAHPTGINSTSAGTRLNYGAIYTHTMTSSTGKVKDLDGVLVTEEVKVGRDDFGTGWPGVPIGTITAPLNDRGEMDDKIGTPAGMIHPLMPKVKKLPAVFDTPQTLHWQDSGGSWNKFASVAITFFVRRNKSGKLEAVTEDNGVQVAQSYTGPPPGGGP